jgi:hypothetical protein
MQRGGLEWGGHTGLAFSQPASPHVLQSSERRCPRASYVALCRYLYCAHRAMQLQLSASGGAPNRS